MIFIGKVEEVSVTGENVLSRVVVVKFEPHIITN